MNSSVHDPESVFASADCSHLDSSSSCTEETDDDGGWRPNFDSMESEDIATWIDCKARIIFPVTFLIFNILYWCFAFRVDCQLWKNCGEDDSKYEF